MDSDTNVLVGAIHDQDRAGSIFDGAIDELRVWGVDRTQVGTGKGLVATTREGLYESELPTVSARDHGNVLSVRLEVISRRGNLTPVGILRQPGIRRSSLDRDFP